MKHLKHLNKYLLKYKHLLILGTIFITLSKIFSIVPAQMVRQGIDLITENLKLNQVLTKSGFDKQMEDHFLMTILLFGLVILVMALLNGLFLFLTRQTIIVMSRHIEFDLKNEVYQHYQSLPLSFYRRNNTGDLMNRISEDVGRVRMYVGPAIMYAINLIVLFVLVISYMFTVNVELTLYSLIPLPILSVSIYYVSSKMNKQSERIQRSLSGLSTFVQEAFSGIRVLKSFVREDDSASRFLEESNNYKKQSLKLALINSLFFPLIMTLIGLSVVFTVYIGGNQVMAGSITVGNIAEFVIYINMLTWPVTSVGWVTSLIQRAAASQERINEFLETKNDLVSTTNLEKNIAGEIEFKHVSLIYPDSGIKALDDVSFTIQQGQTMAIVGNTGSGKSTIANLICRMYDPTTGEITIDGINQREFKLQNLRSQIGYVPQDSFLFSDSISENIAFGLDSYTDADIERAAKNADIYDNITGFPKGFDTILGERGITLSGGQKQRVSLARALVKNPRILILDDSLSAVDTKTEDKILENLQQIMREKTSVIISHRVSSVKLADKIIVLEDGKIIEQGSHEELMSANGAYKELYEKQLEEEVE